MSWSFTFEIEPIGKGRPRFSSKGGGRAYTPAKTREWTRAASLLFSQAWGSRNPIERDTAVGVNITAIFPRLKKHKAKKYSTGRIPKTSKPDKDNIEKICLDSMGAILTDDCQVTEGRTAKYWGAVGEAPKIIVDVWVVQDNENLDNEALDEGFLSLFG